MLTKEGRVVRGGIMALWEGLAIGGGAVGGYVVWRRLRGWEPSGDRAGETVARAGIEVADRVGRLAEGTGRLMTDAGVAGIRIGGELTSKTVGASMNAMGDVIDRVTPGRHHDEAEPEKPAPKAKTAAPAKKRADTKKTPAGSKA